MCEFFRCLLKAPQLKKLVLCLRNTKIQGCNAIIGESLSKLLNLQSLELVLSTYIYIYILHTKRTNIADDQVIGISKAIVCLQSLESVTIKLDNTSVSTASCRYVARIPATLSNLKHFTLNLNQNVLGPQGVEFISAGLKLSKGIQSLDLMLDQIGCYQDGCYYLADALKRLASLQTLNLTMAGNQISSPSLHTLADALLRLKSKCLTKIVLDFRK